MPVVSNSGPVLAFGRADLLSLLKDVVSEIHIPEAVYEEIVLQGAGRPAADQIAKAIWIKRGSVRDRRFLAQLSKRLHLGEQEAIALARESGWPLLIDEKAARLEAHRLGISYLGSLRILQTAKEDGLIKEIKPVLDQMIASGMYVHKTLYGWFLMQNSE